MRSRIVVVDGQQLMREGLVALLNSDQDFEVVGHTGDGSDGVRLSKQHRPNMVIMDLMTPGLNGVDATRRIVASEPTTRVLCLADSASSLTLAAALDAGATGLLLKSCAYGELRQALLAQMQRHFYLSPLLTARALDSVKRVPGQEAPAHPFKKLTPKEREVVQLIAEGLSTKAIARRLEVSFKTIATHRDNVKAKLGIRSVAELTRYAVREGLAAL